jgi:hypothetical protein
VIDAYYDYVVLSLVRDDWTGASFLALEGMENGYFRSTTG